MLAYFCKKVTFTIWTLFNKVLKGISTSRFCALLRRFLGRLNLLITIIFKIVRIIRNF